MKMIFKNLGPISKGELELSELTVLCGQNNSGKTYITYALYCLLKSWISLARINLSDEVSSLRLKGFARINITEKVVNAWPEISKKVLADFSETFPAMMASNNSLFEKTKIDWTIDLTDDWKEHTITNELRNAQEDLLLSISKAKGSEVAEITVANLGKEFIGGTGVIQFLSNALIELALSDVMPDVFMASSERTGATIFRRDLNLAKNNVLDLLAQLNQEDINEVNPGKTFATLYKRNYARPVDDNVRFANSLPSADNENGELAKLHPELLDYFSHMVGGQYVTNKDGATHFQPSKTKLKLGLGETSSAVRSLLIIWYWLKYQAKPGSMLMIDEPELNLHPENQRRFARFLAKLVNLGVKVFITTHSDTIIREFNTLIMLSRNLPHISRVRDKNGYSSDEKLGHNQVVLYVTGQESNNLNSPKRKHGVTTLLKIVPDEKLGLDVDTFDQTILDMNQMQDELRYGES